MPEAELRRLRGLISELEVNENKQWDYRCSRDRDGIVYCGAKEYKKNHVEEGGFVALKDDTGSIEYVDTLGSEGLRRKILKDLGKGALR